MGYCGRLVRAYVGCVERNKFGGKPCRVWMDINSSSF